MVRILSVLIAVLFLMSAVGAMIPVLPYKVLYLGGKSGLSSMIFSIYSLGSLLMVVFWGYLSDWIGRKKVLILLSFLTCCSYLFLFYAGTVNQVFAARFFAGLVAGFLPVTQAYISDVFESKDRSHGFALLGVMVGLSFVIGPFLSVTLMNVYGFASPILLSAILAIAAGFIVCFLRQPAVAAVPPIESHLRGATTKDKRKVLYLLSFIALMVSFLFSMFQGVLAVFILKNFGFFERDLGKIMVFIGLIMMGVQGVIFKRLVLRWGEVRVLLLALLVFFVGYGVLLFPPSIALFYGGIALVAVGVALHDPSMQGLLSFLSIKDYGVYLSWGMAMFSIGRILGPFVGGLLLEMASARAAFMCCFILGTLLFVLVCCFKKFLVKFYSV